jgi:hypothetical protein
MNKLTTLTLIAGIATALTTMAAAAQVAGKGPNYPAAHSQEHCADTMGHMRRVSQADIAAIGNQPVVLIPVCEDLTVPFRNVYGPLFVNGNANLLRRPIARSQALMNALRGRQYDQHDVVSVRFGGNHSIILYVHQRDMN